MITYKRKRNREFPHVRNATDEGGSQEEQHRETQSMGFRLMDLPSSIIIEILKKMRAEEVLQCRCTSKTLCQLIFDPSFANHFLVRSPFFSLVYRPTSRKINFARIEGDEFRASKTLDLDHVRMQQISQNSDLELVGSSKGILCLWKKSSNGNNLYVANPLLGEYAILPKPLDKFATVDETYWFGYVPPMGIFKVIRVKLRRALLQSNPRKYYNKSEVHVLAIGSNAWKYGGDAPFPHHGMFCKTIVNGCLHWIVCNDKDSLQLHSFNMEEDRSHSFPPPPRLGIICCFFVLGVVKNHLSLIGSNFNRQHIEIWSMKEYGVSSSWARYFTIRIVNNYFLVKPITFWKNEELKFLWYNGLLLLYDPNEKKYSGCFNLGRKRNDDVWIYTPSFLSLTHLCLGSRLRVKNTKSYLPY